MEKFERQSLELSYDSHIVALYKDTLKTPDGRLVEYDYIKHKSGGGAGVLLVDDKEYTYLVKQYRNSIDAIDMEIPAGGYSFVGESGEVCAKREAGEETGHIPQKIYHVSNIVSSIGTFDEKTDVYIGTDLEEVEVNYDPNEFIDLVYISIDDAISKIYSGEIIDSKTVVALFAYKDMKAKGIIK